MGRPQHLYIVQDNTTVDNYVVAPSVEEAIREFNQRYPTVEVRRVETVSQEVIVHESSY